MSDSKQPRVAKGTPKRGGQWSSKRTGEAGDVELVDPAGDAAERAWKAGQDGFYVVDTRSQPGGEDCQAVAGPFRSLNQAEGEMFRLGDTGDFESRFGTELAVDAAGKAEDAIMRGDDTWDDDPRFLDGVFAEPLLVGV